MHIVTDTAVDVAPEDMEGLPIHIVPQSFTLDGKTYLSGVDVQVKEFYELLAATEEFPTTAQPAPGEFAEVYRQLAATDPDILSIHVSSGLSGTLNAAMQGAKMVEEANITFVDTKTLSVGSGWQLLAAARAIKAGWTIEQIVPMLQRISFNSFAIFTLAELKYLVHGGRVSHIKGLLARILDIKPLIGVDKESGMYEQLGQARSLKKAMARLIDVAGNKHPDGSRLRIQIVHGDAPDHVERLQQMLSERFECNFMTPVQVAPILACHTGPTLIGYCFAPESIFEGQPAD